MAEHYSPVGCYCLVLAFQIPLHSKFKDQGYAEEIFKNSVRFGFNILHLFLFREKEKIKIVLIHFFSTEVSYEGTGNLMLCIFFLNLLMAWKNILFCLFIVVAK